MQRASRGGRKHDPPAGACASKLDGTQHNHNGKPEADRGKGLRDGAETLIGDDGDR